MKTFILDLHLRFTFYGAITYLIQNEVSLFANIDVRVADLLFLP